VFCTSLRQVNLVYAFRAREGVHRGHKVYIGLGRMSLLLVIAGLRYGTIDDQTRSRGYKRLREGGEAPKSLYQGGSGA
jgi:ATP sulfurylase